MIRTMATSATPNDLRSRVLRPLTGLGNRATDTALRPVAAVVNAAAETGMDLERRAVDRVLASDELGRVLTAAIESVQVQTAVINAVSGDAARRTVDAIFDSGLVDRIAERLLTSSAIWHVIDEIAASPAVTAAISQQGIGSAGQMGEEVRDRSRGADDWAERAARRLIHRPPRPLSVPPDATA
jgi:hypothetical protein